MKIGSFVQVVKDFTKLSNEWGLVYPKKNEVLTISSIIPHHNKHCRQKGIILLNFEEYPNGPSICDKTIHNVANFVELLLPKDIQDILNEPLPEFIKY